MPYFYKEQSIMCPYYVIAKANAGYDFYITCEGIDKAQYVTIRFKSSKDRNDYLDKYCCQYPTNCPLAKAIDVKYEEC